MYICFEDGTWDAMMVHVPSSSDVGDVPDFPEDRKPLDNEIIKFLTIFTVLFIPPTFLVGLWGMNFDFMPELAWEYGYIFALLLISALIVSLLFFFRKKKWL